MSGEDPVEYYCARCGARWLADEPSTCTCPPSAEAA